MRIRSALAFFASAFFAGLAMAGTLEVLPPCDLDPTVPSIRQVLGYDWGEEISDPQQIQKYAEALAAAVPQRVKLLPYAKSFEGRPLFLLVVGAAEHLAGLEGLAAQVRRLGDPRLVPPATAGPLVAKLPLVVWLGGSVHGDEPSGGEAALALAYYLAASRCDQVKGLLEQVMVVLDPMQNPDGRARFVAATRQARGPHPDENPASAEHVQPWPGGRFSHYLFDLNRDWFALTHPESQGKVSRMVWLPPQVAVDLHEMGSDQGYFFPPPADPHNPLVSPEQNQLWQLLGRQLAAAFDARGVRFWTREVFDAFYPGYGESWPFFGGSCGATYEQASSRGRVIRLRTGELLRYADTVAHHLLAAWVTVKTAAEHRHAFWESFLAYRRRAVEEGKGSAYLWDAQRDGATPLARLLVRQGLEVYRAEGGPLAGLFIVPRSQPYSRLAQVLLSKDIPLPRDFAERQVQREAKRLPDEIYDITAWSLPLLWNVPVREERVTPTPQWQLVSSEEPAPGRVEGEGRVAFLLPWEGLASARATVQLLALGVRVGAAERAFRLAGREFPMGTVVIRRAGNGEELRQRLAQVAAEAEVSFFGAETSLVEAGIDLGSNRVRPLRYPRVGLLWDAPTSPTAAGHLRYALEQQLGLAVSPVRAGSLLQADLSLFDVIIFPDVFSAAALLRTWPQEQLDRLRYWVREGGVLIAEGEAAVFLTNEKVALLASSLEKRGNGEAAQAKEKPQPAGSPTASEGPTVGYEQQVKPAEEQPPQVPGAILTVRLDPEELLAAGFPQGRVSVLVGSRRVFTPLKLDKGVNVGLYADAAELVSAGFVFPDSRKQLPGKAYLVMQRHGRGLVVAFAEPPAFRGMTRSTTLLLANAVLFGPALVP
ncbi:MAG: M14 family metallopeptidase [Thermoanaerobaculum sp.]|nr:M14 family metallopeptidase [Thermoanaerobaculum sp.]